jgi:hypothetical protein
LGQRFRSSTNKGKAYPRNNRWRTSIIANDITPPFIIIVIVMVSIKINP